MSHDEMIKAALHRERCKWRSIVKHRPYDRCYDVSVVNGYWESITVTAHEGFCDIGYLIKQMGQCLVELNS